MGGVFLFAFAFATLGCNGAHCTDLACDNAAHGAVVPPEGKKFALGTGYTLTIAPFPACSFALPATNSHSAATGWVDCPGGFERPGVVATPESIGFSAFGAPATLMVRLDRNGVVLTNHALVPTYLRRFPNGEECDGPSGGCLEGVTPEIVAQSNGQ